MRELNQARATERRLPSNLLNVIWECTEEKSPLRKYVVDTWHNGHISSPDKYPKELLFEIASTINTRPHNPKVRLSPEEIERYYVDETYRPLPSSDSGDDSSVEDNADAGEKAKNDVQNAMKQEASSMKRKRPGREEELNHLVRDLQTTKAELGLTQWQTEAVKSVDRIDRNKKQKTEVRG